MQYCGRRRVAFPGECEVRGEALLGLPVKKRRRLGAGMGRERHENSTIALPGMGDGGKKIYLSNNIGKLFFWVENFSSEPNSRLEAKYMYQAGAMHLVVRLLGGVVVRAGPAGSSGQKRAGVARG
jgi:hypothetical protein